VAGLKDTRQACQKHASRKVRDFNALAGWRAGRLVYVLSLSRERSGLYDLISNIDHKQAQACQPARAGHRIGRAGTNTMKKGTR
jgi:hypothetical protein